MHQIFIVIYIAVVIPPSGVTDAVVKNFYILHKWQHVKIVLCFGVKNRVCECVRVCLLGKSDSKCSCSLLFWHIHTRVRILYKFYHIYFTLELLPRTVHTHTHIPYVYKSITFNMRVISHIPKAFRSIIPNYEKKCVFFIAFVIVHKHKNRNSSKWIDAIFILKKHVCTCNKQQESIYMAIKIHTLNRYKMNRWMPFYKWEMI